MKKTTMALLFALVTIASYGQLKQPKYDGEYIYVTLENGVGVEKNLKLSLSKSDYEKVKTSDLFKNWKTETWNNPKNLDYISEHKGWDEVIMYLNGEITMSKFYTKFKLKNGNSLDFIDSSKGMIYFSDNNGIRISYPIMAQNGYGNSIVGKTIFSIDMKNGKRESVAYVYSD